MAEKRAKAKKAANELRDSMDVKLKEWVEDVKGTRQENVSSLWIEASYASISKKEM